MLHNLGSEWVPRPRGGTVYAYCTPLVGYTVKTNTTDIQTVDSDYSKTIHHEMEEDHKTKEARDEGVEKHSCQIELRGIHLKLVYYNGKQVLCACIMVHVSAVLHVRNEDELVIHIQCIKDLSGIRGIRRVKNSILVFVCVVSFHRTVWVPPSPVPLVCVRLHHPPALLFVSGPLFTSTGSPFRLFIMNR